MASNAVMRGPKGGLFFMRNGRKVYVKAKARGLPVRRIGKGFLDWFKRKGNALPPAVRKFLETKGSQQVTKIQVYRAPLHKTVDKILSVISFGTWGAAKQHLDYDKVFHLYVVLTLQDGSKWRLEKEAVIHVVPFSESSLEPDVEQAPPVDHPNTTVANLFEKGKIDPHYNAKTSNCQMFVLGLLEGIGQAGEGRRAWILQDAPALFARMPAFTERIAKTATDLGAVTDRVLHGQGMRKYRRRNFYQRAR